MIKRSNTLEHLRKIKATNMPGQGKNKRQRMELVDFVTSSEDSDDSEESPPWTAYSQPDIELMKPYYRDFELAEEDKHHHP